MRTFRLAGLGLLLALGFAGCAPGPAVRSPAETAEAARAAELARQGRFDEAAQAYQALAAGSAVPDHYLLQAAESYREEGAIARAAPLLEQIHGERLTDDERARYVLLRAEAALARNDPATALKLTTQPGLNLPAALRPRLLELRARAQEATHDDWAAAQTRVALDAELKGIDQTQNRKQAIALLSRLGAPALRQRAAAMPPDDPMLPWVNEALAALGEPVGHAQATLGAPVGTLLPGAGANVREGFQMPARIALLLPASGPFAEPAQAIREGFFAAYADDARNHVPRGEVRVYDSGGDAAGALKAYRQAVADGARLVIGPLVRGEVSALFGQPLPVPLLALNHPDDRGLPANGASEFGLLPETEGAQAADHLAERGVHTAYAIVAAADFAQRAARAFGAEFEARGGHLAGTVTLPAGVNYAAAIGSLHLDGAATDAGIFISMRPQEARLLLPQLRLARVTLPVVGTSHIWTGVDDPGADADLNDVEFCDAPWLFDAQPGLPEHARMAALLPSARGTSARLFAFGMDAWKLAPYLDWLRAHPGSYLPGASGQLTADPFGRVRRVLIWARFSDGLARPLSGSLELDVPAAAPPAPAPAAAASAPVPP